MLERGFGYNQQPYQLSALLLRMQGDAGLHVPTNPPHAHGKLVGKSQQEPLRSENVPGVPPKPVSCSVGRRRAQLTFNVAGTGFELLFPVLTSP